MTTCGIAPSCFGCAWSRPRLEVAARERVAGSPGGRAAHARTRAGRSPGQSGPAARARRCRTRARRPRRGGRPRAIAPSSSTAATRSRWPCSAACSKRKGASARPPSAFAKRVAVDPRPAWKDKHDSLDARAKFEALPAEYRSIPSAATVTRGQLAAMIGIELKAMIDARAEAAGCRGHRRAHALGCAVDPSRDAGRRDGRAARITRSSRTPSSGAAIWRRCCRSCSALAVPRRPAELTAWRAARPLIADVPREPCVLSGGRDR